MKKKLPLLPMRAPLLALAVLSLLGACDREVEPELPSGSFALFRTQRGDLPATLGDRDNCFYSAVGGSVVLRADSFDAVLLRERQCLPTGPVSDSIPTISVDTFADRGSGSFEAQGDSLYFHDRRGVATGVGVLTGDTLVVEGPGQTLYYRLEPPR